MPASSLKDRHAAALRTLESVGQSQVLRYYDKLDDAARAVLLAQIESIDWPELARLIESHVKKKPTFTLPEKIAPAPWYPNVPTTDKAGHYKTARALGEKLIREGKVAAFTVAGGQARVWAGTPPRARSPRRRSVACRFLSRWPSTSARRRRSTARGCLGTS